MTVVQANEQIPLAETMIALQTPKVREVRSEAQNQSILLLRISLLKVWRSSTYWTTKAVPRSMTRYSQRLIHLIHPPFFPLTLSQRISQHMKT